ncbi:uncharacterized protein LOC114328020 [Diabrotica virgifera virgifera]|uniref:Telomeric repeat-binding factor 2-interacting protein 1 n=2 Tax=Diabrotica virgifera virgifera TaxID=50390 RepID=A0A6P7FHI2_DIAVI|nr:uncharacterized protein LOC114328020 [Diabrotica virgifera virgifera]
MSGYRRAYTINEDNLILTWIVRSKAYYHLRGTILWRDLEHAEIFSEDRSWESLKNRFIRKILPDLSNPSYTLSQTEKEKIMLAWSQTAQGFVASSDSEWSLTIAPSTCAMCAPHTGASN